MHFKLVIVLAISIGYVNSVESFDEEEIVIVEGNVTADDYYNASPYENDCRWSKQKKCIAKCCPFGFASRANEALCLNVTHIVFNPLVHDEYQRVQSATATDLFYFAVGFPNCEENEARFVMSSYAAKLKKEFYLRKDGNLYLEVPHTVPPSLLVPPGKYCIDNFVTVHPDGTESSKFDAVVCYSATKHQTDHLLSSTCMLISCVFFLATVGVYAWIPKLHNVHGGVLIAYLLCLFVGFLLMATMQLLLLSGEITHKACINMSIAIYFFLLSAFFWLNVMCYDIWCVFNGKRDMRQQKELVLTQLRKYAFYAFSIPTILTVLLTILEFSDLPPHPWLPMLSTAEHCFFTGRSRLIYLYGPIMLLCAANIVLFLLTALRIAKIKSETSTLNSGESNRHDQNDNQQTLFLYVKLFIVMGINWILEVISALYPDGYWAYTDAYNVLIGFFIFIIFVCKRDILLLLKERLC